MLKLDRSTFMVDFVKLTMRVVTWWLAGKISWCLWFSWYCDFMISLWTNVKLVPLASYNTSVVNTISTFSLSFLLF